MKNKTYIFGTIIFIITCLTFIGERIAIYFKPDYNILEWWHYMIMIGVSMALYTLTDKQIASFIGRFINKKIKE